MMAKLGERSTMHAQEFDRKSKQIFDEMETDGDKNIDPALDRR